MDIKEIALKVGLQVFEEHPYDKGHVVSPSDYTWIDDKLIEFAEALIESYKAELLKEVTSKDVLGEPVAELVLCISANGFGTEWRTDESAWWSAVEPERRAKVFTSDQVAVAVARATKPLEEEIRSREDFIAMLQETQKAQLAKAEQRVAEACSRTAYVQVNWFGYNTLAKAVRKAIRSGEWRKFVKEAMK